MHEYKVRFLDDGYLEDDRLTITGKSEKDIVKHLWNNEKAHLAKIMTNKLTIYEGECMLLFVVDDNEWYYLDDGEPVGIKYLQRHKDHIKVGIKQLNPKQFTNLVTLMRKELCSDYGSAYLEFYQKINDEWIEL